MKIVSRKINGMWFVATEETEAKANAAVDWSAEQVRTNTPVLGWEARPKGSKAVGQRIVYIDHANHGKNAFIRLEGEDKTRCWGECEYYDRAEHASA